MIMSPSQDSFYNGFPGFSQAAEESASFTPMLDSIPQGSSPTSFHPPPAAGSFQAVSSHVQKSGLIVSPSQEDGNHSELRLVRPNPQTSRQATKYASFHIKTITEIEVETESPEDYNPSPPVLEVDEEEDPAGPSVLTQRQLMQESISKGMQDIMAKVVSETKQQNSPNVRKPSARGSSVPSTRGSSVPSSLYPPASSSKPQSHRHIQVQPLICSPMTSTTESKRYPNFVFTPVSGKGQTARSWDNRKGEYSTRQEEEDNWFGGGAKDGLEDSWLENGDARPELIGNVSFGGGTERRACSEESWCDGGTVDGKTQEKSSLLQNREDVVVRGPLQLGEDSGSEGMEGVGEERMVTQPVQGRKPSHRYSERNIETRKKLFREMFEKPSSILTESPAHHHSMKSLAIPSTSDPRYETEMDLVMPLSVILNRKFSDSSNGLQVNSVKTSASTTNLSAKVAGTSVTSSPSMRRSHTDVTVGNQRTSVTKLKRPHSFHISKHPPKDGTGVDFTKDEFIRRAALRGMVKKPRSRRASQDPPTSPHRKEVVSDLDALLLQRKASNESTAVKDTSSEEKTEKHSFGKYYMDRWRSSGPKQSGRDSSSTEENPKRFSYAEIRSRRKSNNATLSKSHSTTELNFLGWGMEERRGLGATDGKVWKRQAEGAKGGTTSMAGWMFEEVTNVEAEEGNGRVNGANTDEATHKERGATEERRNRGEGMTERKDGHTMEWNEGGEGKSPEPASMHGTDEGAESRRKHRKAGEVIGGMAQRREEESDRCEEKDHEGALGVEIEERLTEVEMMAEKASKKTIKGGRSDLTADETGGISAEEGTEAAEKNERTAGHIREAEMKKSGTVRVETEVSVEEMDGEEKEGAVDETSITEEGNEWTEDEVGVEGIEGVAEGVQTEETMIAAVRVDEKGAKGDIEVAAEERNKAKGSTGEEEVEEGKDKEVSREDMEGEGVKLTPKELEREGAGEGDVDMMEEVGGSVDESEGEEIEGSAKELEIQNECDSTGRLPADTIDLGEDMEDKRYGVMRKNAIPADSMNSGGEVERSRDESEGVKIEGAVQPEIQNERGISGEERSDTLNRVHPGEESEGSNEREESVDEFAEDGMNGANEKVEGREEIEWLTNQEERVACGGDKERVEFGEGGMVEETNEVELLSAGVIVKTPGQEGEGESTDRIMDTGSEGNGIRAGARAWLHKESDHEEEERNARPQSASVIAQDYEEAAYIIQHEPEKLCWTQF